MLALRGTCHTESCPCYAVFIVTSLLKDLIKLKNCKPNCLGPLGVGVGVLKKFLGGDVPLGPWNPWPIPDSDEFCYPILNSPNHSYPRVAVFQKLWSLAQSQSKILYHNRFSLKKGFIIAEQRQARRYALSRQYALSRLYALSRQYCLILTSINTNDFCLNPEF